MRTVDMPRTPDELRLLLTAASEGERIVVTRGGEPIVTVSPYTPQGVTLGLMEGEFTVPDWFDEPLPEEMLAGFEGTSGGPGKPLGGSAGP